MGKRVLIVKNITHEGPGLIEVLLKEYQIPYDIADLDRGDPFPSPRFYDALVVLGGPDSANDGTGKMKEELERIHEALSREIPYLGICLGLQALVKAAEGKVVKSPVKEIGFRDPEGDFFRVVLTEEGKKDPLFSGFKDSFKIFHLHGETVTLKKEMVLLGKGKFCLNQGVRVGKTAYGLQGHLELIPGMFEVWMKKDPDLLKFDPEGLRKDFTELQKESVKTSRRLFTNFLNVANLLSHEAPMPH